MKNDSVKQCDSGDVPVTKPLMDEGPPSSPLVLELVVHSLSTSGCLPFYFYTPIIFNSTIKIHIAQAVSLNLTRFTGEMCVSCVRLYNDTTTTTRSTHSVSGLGCKVDYVPNSDDLHRRVNPQFNVLELGQKCYPPKM